MAVGGNPLDTFHFRYEKEDFKMGIQNTKTEENLRKALAGESIARNKYTYFA